jgi:hypothetical protein
LDQIQKCFCGLIFPFATVFGKTLSFLRAAIGALAEVRTQKALIEVDLYRGCFRHRSKFDDDLLLGIPQLMEKNDGKPDGRTSGT